MQAPVHTGSACPCCVVLILPGGYPAVWKSAVESNRLSVSMEDMAWGIATLSLRDKLYRHLDGLVPEWPKGYGNSFEKRISHWWMPGLGQERQTDMEKRKMVENFPKGKLVLSEYFDKQGTLVKTEHYKNGKLTRSENLESP